MFIKELHIKDFRNINSSTITFFPNINIILGNNGKGKTSILEALYYLSTGKSFRTAKPSNLINIYQDSFYIFAKIIKNKRDNNIASENTISSCRTLQNLKTLKFNGDIIKRQQELMCELPIQIIYPNDINCFMTPRDRIALIDYGVFSISKNLFMDSYVKLNNVLKQYREALRQSYPKSYIKSLNILVSDYSKIIDFYRSKYIKELIGTIKQYLNDKLEHIEIKYFKGWSNTDELQDILDLDIEKCYATKHIRFGAHRANIYFLINGICVTKFLSRGELKHLIIALKIARGILYNKSQENNSTIYLVDDMSAELDVDNYDFIMNIFNYLQSQIIITSIKRDIKYCDNYCLIDLEEVLT